MPNTEFSVKCHNCAGEVNSYIEKTRHILTEDGAIFESLSVELSCGCIVDFAEWQIDFEHCILELWNFAGALYLKFYDSELPMEDE